MRKLFLASALLLSTLLLGCSKTYYLGRETQSEFTYPNSNVQPLEERVSGSASKTGFFSTPSVTAEMQKQAISEALSKSAEGDLLINYSKYLKKTTIPLPLLQITTVEYIVEGPPATEEVGKQDLE